MTNIIQHPGNATEMTVADVRDRVNLAQKVMQSVMKADTHYGVIPGCAKPTLYKAGSEVLLMTFRVATEVDVDDLSTGEDVRYRVRVRGIHQVTGAKLGEGVGECSSNEEKYKWRAAVCAEEFGATPEARRRIKYGKKRGGGHYTVTQVRTEPADVANTVLKMAKKRAQIDFTLTALAASDIFTQDIEDVPEELRDSHVDQPPARAELQDYPAERFGQMLPSWQKLVDGGKNPNQIVTMVSSKARLSEAQIKTILDLTPSEKPADDWGAEYDAAQRAQE